MRLTIACFLWDGGPHRQSAEYGPQHVCTLANMCARHAPGHRFVCLSDREIEGIETVCIDPEVLEWPRRYPKLILWRDDMREKLGERVLCLDLDVVIVSDITPLVDRDEDVVLWQEVGNQKNRRYNTSMILLKTGARADVWNNFPGPGYQSKRTGSDQAYASDYLGDEATWKPEDGVYSYKYDLNRGELPDDARIVFFHGKPKPWQVSNNWVLEHYQ